MTSLYSRIDAVMTDLYVLHDAGRLRVVREHADRRPEPETVRAIDARVELPPFLRALFAEVGSLAIEWEAPLPEPDGGRTHFRGSMSVPSIDRMFGDWTGSLWFDTEPADLPARALHPLDKFTPEWWAVMRGGEDHVYLHEAGCRDLHPTGLTVAEWFELSLEARFYEGWLFAFAPHTTDSVMCAAKWSAGSRPSSGLSISRALSRARPPARSPCAELGRCNGPENRHQWMRRFHYYR